MAINTNATPAGVNVNINGAVYIGGQNLIAQPCTAALGGTFEQQNGCFYFCDGQYWQTLNLEFTGDDSTANRCNTTPYTVTTRCTLGKAHFRAGDKTTAYNEYRSINNCKSETVTCTKEGTWSPAGYTHPTCMLWDGTTDPIDKYEPDWYGNPLIERSL
jgi:hypothetical protein